MIISSSAPLFWLVVVTVLAINVELLIVSDISNDGAPSLTNVSIWELLFGLEPSADILFDKDNTRSCKTFFSFFNDWISCVIFETCNKWEPVPFSCCFKAVSTRSYFFSKSSNISVLCSNDNCNCVTCKS